MQIQDGNIRFSYVAAYYSVVVVYADLNFLHKLCCWFYTINKVFNHFSRSLIARIFLNDLFGFVRLNWLDYLQWENQDTKMWNLFRNFKWFVNYVHWIGFLRNVYFWCSLNVKQDTLLSRKIVQYLSCYKKRR